MCVRVCALGFHCSRKLLRGKSQHAVSALWGEGAKEGGVGEQSHTGTQAQHPELLIPMETWPITTHLPPLRQPGCWGGGGGERRREEREKERGMKPS